MITLAIKAVIIAAIIASLSDILYAIECALCKFIGFLDSLFDMLAGVTPILYKTQNAKLQYDPVTGGAKVASDGVTVAKSTTLIEVVFSNSSINKIFWNMALIGIAMVFGFAIFAVIRKMFDTRDRMKHSMGDIISNSIKSIILICAMNLIVTVALSGSQILLNTMNSVFKDSGGQDISYTITYDDDDYAAMLRCLNTIGNYSLNPSRNSRYNLNACFNDIQEDLEYLKQKGIFKYPYRFELTTTDPETGDTIVKLSGEDSWQSVLYDIAMFGSGAEVYIDDYNEGRNDAILNAMDILSNNKNFKPLEKYTVTMAGTKTREIKVDRMVMLLGTMDAAWNDDYNKTMSFGDDLRAPFLYGDKNIYNHSQMNSAFDYWLFTWHHILVIFFAILFIKEYLGLCFNAVARIFNMIFLYLVSPAFIAVTPLDDGGKTKQWSTAFIIQTFALFGSVLGLRLFKLIVNIVVTENIIFFADGEDQMCAQAVFVLACAYVLKRAGGMITGILADNAGMQAINASDLMGEAGGVVDRVKGGMTTAGRKAFGLAYGAAAKGGGALDKRRENRSKQSSSGNGKSGSSDSGDKTVPKSNSKQNDGNSSQNSSSDSQSKSIPSSQSNLKNNGDAGKNNSSKNSETQLPTNQSGKFSENSQIPQSEAQPNVSENSLPSNQNNIPEGTQNPSSGTNTNVSTGSIPGNQNINTGNGQGSNPNNVHAPTGSIPGNQNINTGNGQGTNPNIPRSSNVGNQNINTGSGQGTNPNKNSNATTGTIPKNQNVVGNRNNNPVSGSGSNGNVNSPSNVSKQEVSENNNIPQSNYNYAQEYSNPQNVSQQSFDADSGVQNNYIPENRNVIDYSKGVIDLDIDEI